MTTEQKLNSMTSFCDWLADKKLDNILENKTETFEDLLYEYVCGLDNDDTFEDEFETYETMANHIPQVARFLYKQFGIEEKCSW